MLAEEKKGARAARRDLCRACDRDAMAVGEFPRPLTVSSPFSRMWPGPVKIVSMKEGSLMWTSSGLILIMGPQGNVRFQGRIPAKREYTVFLVHSLNLPSILSAANNAMIEYVEVCCS